MNQPLLEDFWSTVNRAALKSPPQTDSTSAAQTLVQVDQDVWIRTERDEWEPFKVEYVCDDGHFMVNSGPNGSEEYNYSQVWSVSNVEGKVCLSQADVDRAKV